MAGVALHQHELGQQRLGARYVTGEAVHPLQLAIQEMPRRAAVAIAVHLQRAAQDLCLPGLDNGEAAVQIAALGVVLLAADQARFRLGRPRIDEARTAGQGAPRGDAEQDYGAGFPIRAMQSEHHPLGTVGQRATDRHLYGAQQHGVGQPPTTSVRRFAGTTSRSMARSKRLLRPSRSSPTTTLCGGAGVTSGPYEPVECLP